MSNMTLDQLLEIARESEPVGDGFVRMVMDDVKKEEQRRWRLRLVRRPVVIGVTSAVVAMSGAVAAFVGTHVGQDNTTRPQSSASVSVTAGPQTGPAGAVRIPAPSKPGAGPVVTAANGLHWGFPSSHTSWVLDDKSGLKLVTEIYGNSFAVGRAQQVTVTLINTSSKALAVTGAGTCPLSVVASQGGKASDPVCAAGAVPQDNIVLAPGGSTSATARISLGRAGSWSIASLCNCTYKATDAAPPEVPLDATQPQQTGSANGFGNLLNQSLTGGATALSVPTSVPEVPVPAPLPAKSSPADGTTLRLLTPAITVHASG